jgi:hypothetical protein
VTAAPLPDPAIPLVDALDLVGAAVTAKVAAEVGAPRLATAAARRATAIASRLVIALSPDVARVPADVERERLGAARTLEELCAVRWPRVADDPDGPAPRPRG